MLAGGSDALTTWLDVIGFAPAGRADEGLQRRSRARPRGRSTATAPGFVLGEGAVMVVLEDMESARARGATIYAEIAGYGVEPERLPDDRPAARRRRRDAGDGRARCEESGLATEEVDYVVAHGTGTPGNDVSRDGRDQARLRRPRLQAGDQLAEVDDRPPHLRPPAR